MKKVVDWSKTKTYQRLVAAVLSGARCPPNKNYTGTAQPVLVAYVLRQMLKEGFIRIDIYSHNWRVITFLKGPHKGRHTQLPPNEHWRPYKRVEADGTSINGIVAPSKPTGARHRV